MCLLRLREEVIQLRKIWSLYINELLKIARRIVFSVMAVAMIIIMVIAGAIFNASNRYSYYVDYYNDMSEVYKSEIEFYEERIEECKASLRGIAEQFDGWVKENEASSDAEGAALYFYGSIEELYYSCSNLYRYELWLRHDVKERYDDTFYKNECIDKLADCRASEEVKNFINTLEQEIPGFREY